MVIAWVFILDSVGGVVRMRRNEARVSGHTLLLCLITAAKGPRFISASDKWLYGSSGSFLWNAQSKAAMTSGGEVEDQRSEKYVRVHRYRMV